MGSFHASWPALPLVHTCVHVYVWVCVNYFSIVNMLFLDFHFILHSFRWKARKESKAIYCTERASICVSNSYALLQWLVRYNTNKYNVTWNYRLFMLQEAKRIHKETEPHGVMYYYNFKKENNGRTHSQCSTIFPHSVARKIGVKVEFAVQKRLVDALWVKKNVQKRYAFRKEK